MGKLTLNAEGKAKGKFDIVLYTVAVVTKDKEQAAAKRDNDEKMTRVFNVLSELGIAEEDFQTTGYRLTPLYEYPQSGKHKGKEVFVCYEATNSLTVTLRNLDQMDEFLKGVWAAGVTHVNGPSFRMSKPQDVIDTASGTAVDLAFHKARLYCKRTGSTLVRLEDMSEGYVSFSGSNDRNRPMMSKAGMVADAAEAAPSPVSAGQDEVKVQINCVFEIEGGLQGQRAEAGPKAAKK